MRARCDERKVVKITTFPLAVPVTRGLPQQCLEVVPDGVKIWLMIANNSDQTRAARFVDLWTILDRFASSLFVFFFFIQLKLMLLYGHGGYVCGLVRNKTLRLRQGMFKVNVFPFICPLDLLTLTEGLMKGC